MTALDFLVQNLPDVIVLGDRSVDVSDITFDSRQVTTGSLFVALRGDYTDGHQYLEEARAKGAVAALVDRPIDQNIRDRFPAVVQTPDSRAALAVVADRFYRQPSRKLTLVGVTGTDGKTSTSYFIEKVLETAGLTTGLIGTIAVKIPGNPELTSKRQTTPESLHVQRYLALMHDYGCQVAILEATSHGLETHRVDACQFDVGVVTNVTHEHLDFHGSLAAYRAAKAGLFKRVAASRTSGGLGFAVLNADDPGVNAIASAADKCRRIWYSTARDDRAAVRASRIANTERGSSFQLAFGNQSAEVSLQVPGRWSVNNALAAAGVAYALDIPVSTAAKGLSSLKAIPGRMERVDRGQPFTVVVDYAHTPESLKATLTELRATAPGRLLVMFGSAGERDIEKREIQGQLAARLADYAIFTSEDPRFEDAEAIIEAIAAGAERAGWRRDVDFVCVENRRTATQMILRNANPGDVVLLAGKGHERSIIYEDKHIPWNESEVAWQALQSLGYSNET